jgi:hypothetical protein
MPFDDPKHFMTQVMPMSFVDPRGELVECYGDINLRFNVGLTDAAFENPARPARPVAR